MVCEPLLEVVVFQGTEYGAAVTSAPALTPSSWSCTPATPAEVLVVTVIVPPTVAPDAGDVILTVGAAAAEEATPTNRLSRFAVVCWMRGSTNPSPSSTSPQAQLVVPAP